MFTTFEKNQFTFLKKFLQLCSQLCRHLSMTSVMEQRNIPVFNRRISHYKVKERGGRNPNGPP